MAKKIPFRHQNEPKIKLKIRIRKDDTVKVIAGKDKGKTGRVLDVDRVRGRVLVEVAESRAACSSRFKARLHHRRPTSWLARRIKLPKPITPKETKIIGRLRAA